MKFKRLSPMFVNVLDRSGASSTRTSNAIESSLFSSHVQLLLSCQHPTVWKLIENTAKSEQDKVVQDQQGDTLKASQLINDKETRESRISSMDTPQLQQLYYNVHSGVKRPSRGSSLGGSSVGDQVSGDKMSGDKISVGKTSHIPFKGSVSC